MARIARPNAAITMTTRSVSFPHSFAAAMLLALAALVASVVPVRRAAGVEPMQALRNE